MNDKVMAPALSMDQEGLFYIAYHCPACNEIVRVDVHIKVNVPEEYKIIHEREEENG